MMAHTASQIQALPFPGCRLFVKRDDLLPFSFGGNKVRIAETFFADLKRLGCNCMVGYGNARSNLSRALAAMAAAEGIPCYIIAPDDEDGTRTETFNSRLVKASGAVLHPCAKTQVRQTVEKVLADCEAAGLRPYYIYGRPDGTGREAVPLTAYIRAAEEIAAQEEELGVLFDRIFLASGTGMTQAGLILGAALLGRDWEICGISIARPAERCREVIDGRITAWKQENGRTELATAEPAVTDAYLAGGYGCRNPEIEETIRTVYRRFGIPLDPTYSGKAFWGMTEELRAKAAEEENVLFLHTGGGPLFFDYMRTGL